MSLRTLLLPVVETLRGISGPAALDIRTNRLTIRTRTWSGRYVKEGASTDADLVLPQIYPIRFVSDAEIRGSGGKYSITDLLVDHITPFDGISSGWTPAQLNPVTTNDRTEIIYVVTGTEAGEYDLIEANFTKILSYRLVLRRRLTTP